MTLWDLKRGERGTILQMSEDLAAEHLQRMHDLGFAPGEEVECMHTSFLGAPRVYRVRADIFSLESSLARQIAVTAMDGQ